MTGIEMISRIIFASLGCQFIATPLPKHSNLKCLALFPDCDAQGAGYMRISSSVAAALVSSGRAKRKKAVELATEPGSPDLSVQCSISSLPSSS